jgi:hypothetical protein
VYVWAHTYAFLGTNHTRRASSAGVSTDHRHGYVEDLPLGEASLRYLYAPDPLFGRSATSATFVVFVNDGVHLVTQDVTIGVTPTADPTTLAEAETALADNQADLDAAIKDRADALLADAAATTATTAQIEAIMAIALAAKDKIAAIAAHSPSV